MTDLSPRNATFYWTTIFFRQIQNHGIQHLIISPGSRSTPLTLAAAANPHFQKHVILDERSAAFIALGLAKTTNKPAVLICTSGTAVANYFPAVIEARQSGVPMILATADRPPRLRNTGANQSINQQDIFGPYPVLFRDAGKPGAGKNHLKSLKAMADQAVRISTEKQGPVHLNFPFDKPLEPDEDFLQRVSRENEGLNPNVSPISPKSATNNFRLNGEILHEIQKTDHPLIIVGQLAASTSLKHIFSLAKRLKAPVLSEQGITDAKYAIQGFEGFLRNSGNLNELKPDLILRFGLQPASKSLLKAIKHWQPNQHIHFADTDRRIDIAETTTQSIRWNGNPIKLHNFPSKTDNWLNDWKQAESYFFKKSQHLFHISEKLTDGHVYRHFVPQIADHWTVFISNSFPARDQSLFVPFGKQTVFTNRGASGIDGITSTTIGLNIGSNKSGVLFTGDLAFLHDNNALLNHQLVKQPLLIVVINNGGGAIFRMLPIVQQKEYFESYFETPQSVDIKSLVKSYEIPYQKIDSLQKIRAFKLSRWMDQHSSLSVVECETNTEASMALRKKLWDLEL